MASSAQSRIKATRTPKPLVKTLAAKQDRTSARESALRKIAGILEDQMTDMGLSEDEKNRKTAELGAFVCDAVSSSLAPHAKQPTQPHSAAHRA